MLSLPSGVRLYIANEPTDMRKSFDGLCGLVKERFHRDPFTGDVFVFLNRRRDRVKILLWDRNGFWIAMKRLERGTFESWRPVEGGGTHSAIDTAHLVMLLEGIDLGNAKFRRYFSRRVRMQGRGGRAQEADQGRGAGRGAAALAGT